MTLTWKIDEKSLGYMPAGYRVNPEKVTEWVSSIMCMVMSLTKVNLVEADSLENAEFPIVFLEHNNYTKIQNIDNKFSTNLRNEHLVTFCDKSKLRAQMRAPVYLNKNPTDAIWFQVDDDR